LTGQVFDTQEDYALTSLITEPKSGNLLISAFDNSVVKIFDLRQPTKTACLSMMGDTPKGKHKAGALQGVKKLGVYLGESHHITSAWYVVAIP
jgi:hypothetical protein